MNWAAIPSQDPVTQVDRADLADLFAIACREGVGNHALQHGREMHCGHFAKSGLEPFNVPPVRQEVKGNRCRHMPF